MPFYDTSCTSCTNEKEFFGTYEEMLASICESCGCPMEQVFTKNYDIVSGAPRTVGTFAEHHTRQALGG